MKPDYSLTRLSSTGWTLQQFGFVVCIITTTHFAAEAYPSNPGPAIVLVVGAKNIVSFGESSRQNPADETNRTQRRENLTSPPSPTGASFGIVPMVNTWNYFTAYMIVSKSPKHHAAVAYISSSSSLVSLHFFPRKRTIEKKKPN